MWTGRPHSLREVIERSESLWIAIDEFMDEFYMAHGDKAAQAEMISEAPKLTGDIFTDAYIAAMGEHLAMRWDLEVPRWTGEDERLGSGMPKFVPDLKELRAINLVESPYAFRRRNIFTNREPLQRARWPRDVPVIEPFGQMPAAR